MKAVGCLQGQLEVLDVPELRPGSGQVLLEVLRCGICGSDLHARHHCDELADEVAELGYEDFMRSSQQVVFGHEFCGRVAEHGPRCNARIAAGSTVVALPLLRRGSKTHATGLSLQAPGAYAEQVLVEESLMMAVPNGLNPQLAALTEPMSVAWHAVRRGEVKKRDVAIVIGCGPIGLAVIAMLKARGVRAVIASDFSAGRRALASACGADLVVDPSEGSPYADGGERGHLRTIPEGVELVVGTMDKLRRAPIPWQRVWQAAEALGLRPKRPVIFECVGVPGVIDEIISSAPLLSRIVGVGVCMGSDSIRPSMAINKEIELRFVLGYTPLEFSETLHMLAEGKVKAAPLLTGETGLGGVSTSFEVLGDPEAHAKILVDPSSAATEPVSVSLA